MSSNLENYSSATKAYFESQFAAFNALTIKSVERGERVIASNFAAVKAYSEESNVIGQQLLSAKDPQAFFALATNQGKQNAAKAVAYGRQLVEAISLVNADFTKATEAQIADFQSKVTASVNEVTKHAPAGSENAVAIVKSVIGNANAGFEQLTKAAKQSVEAVEFHVVKAVEHLSQSTEKTA